MLPIVYHPDYQIPLRDGHRFPMSKYGYLREILQERGLLAAGKFLSPKPASLGEVCLAHDAAYVNRVFHQGLSENEVRRIGLPQSEKLTRRVRLSAGGTILAAWLAQEVGIACNAAGGSHHAGPEHGAGFCVLNDVGIAAKAAQAQGAVRRILVVDADVHQGDGTALIFSEDPSVFTLSIHAEKNFPARKQRSDLDIALPDGTIDADYLAALQSGLAEALSAIDPELVFFNAGVDVVADDRLGRLSLSLDGLRARDRMVFETVRAAGIPIVGVLGGGYANDPKVVAERHAIMFEEAQRCLQHSAGT